MKIGKQNNGFTRHGGFTIVELIVSVGITAILMVGISAFFSSTFRSMFMAREKVANTQGQFVVNTILDGKFVNTKKLQELGTGGSFAVIKNDMDTGDLPFTFIGSDADDHVVFRDFFVFNGKDGAVSSQISTAIKNPGGLTELNGAYYVTSPLENTIYSCNSSSLASCTDLTVADLNRPMDITDNGLSAPTDILYVTDADNNRVIQIADPTGAKTVTEITTGLNYPTGIEYYDSGTVKYLFVSDTYSHLVKKINLSTKAIETVAGAGDDEVCDPSDGRDHTALFCKLHFPTGLMVHGNELYISDTGNGRVLKVTDPGYPTTFNLEFNSPSGNEGIKEILFSFPSGSDTSGAVLDSFGSEGDFLRETGNTSQGSNEFTYELWTTLVDDTVNTNQCSPEPCTDTKNKIEVAAPDIFNSSDFNKLYMAGDSLTVGSKSGQILNLTSDFSTHQLSGTVVSLTSEVPADTPVNFNFSAVDTTGASAGFDKIDIKFYDETDSLIGTREKYIRVGNGSLGTSEDTISVVSDSLVFPSGLGWGAGGLEVSDVPEYSTDFSGYDYVSNFVVRNFKFTEPNPGDILELNFEADLGKDSEGNDLWQGYSLDADITS